MRRNTVSNLLSCAGLLLGVGCADPECEPGEFKVANICKKLPATDSSVGSAVADDAGRDFTGTIQKPARDASKEQTESKFDASPDNADSTAPDASVRTLPESAPDAPDSAVPACVATVEVCDGHDNDCDGQSDDGVKVRCWPDADGDGFAASASTAVEQCEPCGAKQTAVEPSSVTNTDCADSDPKRAPSLGDVCGDKIDNDCDGVPDDDANNVCGGPCTAQLIGQPNEPCSNKLLGECARTGTYKCQTDGSITCSADVVTGKAESCDGKDNDCDGETDEGVKNACGSCGQVPAEECDGVDNDCDGTRDEEVSCPGPANECQTPICRGGACGTTPKAAGSPCSKGTCDGAGRCSWCGDGIVQAGEDCEPAVSGLWACSSACKRQTIYTTCASDANCIDGEVCAHYGYCSLPCYVPKGTIGDASTCPKPAGAMMTSICGDLETSASINYCSAAGCRQHSDCPLGQTCAANGQGAICVSCEVVSIPLDAQSCSH